MKKALALILCLCLLPCSLSLATAENYSSVTTTGKGGSSNPEDYIFSFWENNGNLIVGMDKDFNVHADLNYLEFGDNPKENAMGQAIATLRRDIRLGYMEDLYFAPVNGVSPYVRGHQGVMFSLEDMKVIAISDSHCVILDPVEMTKEASQREIGNVFYQIYSFLGAGYILATNLGAEVPIFQFEPSKDNPYEYDYVEKKTYEVLYAQYGKTYAWCGGTKDTADLDTFMNWYVAQSLTRYLIQDENETPSLTDFYPSLPVTKDAVSIVIHGDEAIARIIVPVSNGYYVSTLRTDAMDSRAEAMEVLEGYVHSIFKMNGYNATDYKINSYLYADGLFSLSAVPQTAEAAAKGIGTWLDFASRIEKNAAGN